MHPTDPAKLVESLGRSDRLPVLFVGHGSPMNALEDNEFSRNWREIGSALPSPGVILCVSAHWETDGTLVTAMENPPTIHDFGGFPRELFETLYPAPGSRTLAEETRRTVERVTIGLDEGWGLDHGCWSVLKQMFPAATVPVVELSLDYRKSPREHYELARELAPLRERGVLIVGSGNIVHNLRRVVLRGNSIRDFNEPFGLDWAIEADALVRRLIEEGRHAELIEYGKLGSAIQLAVPTPEHYLPMLYALALRREDESLSFFNTKPLAGALTMTSFMIGTETSGPA